MWYPRGQGRDQYCLAVHYSLMTWVMGQIAPSARRQIIQNWDEWLIRPDGCAAIQRDLGRLEKGAEGNLMTFSQGK